ncbi:MAG TPA: TRAP transporter small permease [Burkholderiales bacterium]|nr:TRAP transporter small permease [Burkholderiales bacterium]
MNAISIFDRAASWLMRRLEGLIGLILALMVVLVFGNVVLRYGFNSGIAISEEASRYLFIWLTFLGAIVAVQQHEHLGVDTLVKMLPRGGKLFCVVASELLMLVAVVLLFRGSWKQTLINLHTRSPVSQVPLALIYVAGLVASVLMGALILRNLYKVLVVGASEEDLILTVESEDLANLEQSKALFAEKKERT